MLQQIANRIQRDSRSCEDKLILARNALQAVSQLLILLVCVHKLHKLQCCGCLKKKQNTIVRIFEYVVTDTFTFVVLLSLI